jgi:hypothetical protein
VGLQPIYCAPGICKINSLYASGKQFGYGNGRIGTGRYTDGTGHRFVAGFPEKIGGWVSGAATAMVGRPNFVVDFRDATGANHLCIGTSSHLYTYNGTTFTDITPYRYFNAGTLTNPLTIVNNNVQVTVTDSNSYLTVGQWIFIGSYAVGGIVINGWYQVTNSTPGTSFTFNLPFAPSSGGGSGLGGTLIYQYPTTKLGTNPFATTNTSKTVTVTHNAHGATTGDYVQFSGATTFNNVTISGEYQLTVVNANSYTIQSATTANANGSGGGTNVIVSYDVTMTPFQIGAGTAYGSGLYGVGPYGYSLSTVTTLVQGWTLAAYGIDVMAAPIGGTIYHYSSTAGGRAFPLLNAPATVNAIFVTPERFIFALGINGNGLQMAWPDQSDPTNWTPTATNTANSGRTLQGGDYFIGGLAVANGVSLMWTNKTAFLAQYVGGNTVYSTPILADGAQIISPSSMTVHGGVVYWQSDHDFWMYNGTVSRLPSDDIRDYVFTTENDTEGIQFPGINTSYQGLATCYANRAKQEVWFHYPDASSNDNNRYIIYHTDQQIFSIGVNVPRTAGIDSHLFNSPYATDLSGNIWQHEVGVDAAGAALDFNLTSSPIDISNGENGMDVMGFIPDVERITGSLSLTIYTQQYPEDTPTADGPYTMSPDSPGRQDLRSDGKLVSFRLDSNGIGYDIRWGLMRLDIKPANARL